MNKLCDVGRAVHFLTITLGVCLIVSFLHLKCSEAHSARTPLHPTAEHNNNRWSENLCVGWNQASERQRRWVFTTLLWVLSPLHPGPGVRTSEVRGEPASSAPPRHPARPGGSAYQEVAIGSGAAPVAEAGRGPCLPGSRGWRKNSWE